MPVNELLVVREGISETGQRPREEELLKREEGQKEEKKEPESLRHVGL